MLTLTPHKIQTFISPYLSYPVVDRTPRRRCQKLYNGTENRFSYCHVANITSAFLSVNSENIYAEVNLQSVLDYLNADVHFQRPTKKDLEGLLKANLYMMVNERRNFVENLKRFFSRLTVLGWESIEETEHEKEYEEEQEWNDSDYREIPQELCEV